jgi:hypothetical protein
MDGILAACCRGTVMVVEEDEQFGRGPGNNGDYQLLKRVRLTTKITYQLMNMPLTYFCA